MGTRCYKNNCNVGIRFRAIELTGKLTQEHREMNRFKHVLLLNNDAETLLYAEQNLSKLLELVVMVEKQVKNRITTAHDDSNSLSKSLESLLDSVLMKPENNLLDRITSSLKKALLSLAIERYKSDRSMICNALGLSENQLDEELRTCGVSPVDDSD